MVYKHTFGWDYSSKSVMKNYIYTANEYITLARSQSYIHYGGAVVTDLPPTSEVCDSNPIPYV